MGATGAAPPQVQITRVKIAAPGQILLKIFWRRAVLVERENPVARRVATVCGFTAYETIGVCLGSAMWDNFVWRGPCRADAVKRLRRSSASLRPLRGDCAAATWHLATMIFLAAFRP